MANEYFWSDVDDALTKQDDGDVQRDDDIQAIFNSLTNIIQTVQGERRMLPTFASNIYGLLFEPIDNITARLIAEGIIEAIKVWEDRIDLTGFDIEPQPDLNRYRCNIKFTIVGSDEVESVEFILTR